MYNVFTVIRILFRKYPIVNVVLTLIMSTVLFFASMLVCEYSLSENELSCYKTLAKQNAVIVGADDAAFDFGDDNIIAVYAYKTAKSVIGGKTFTLRYFSKDYLSQLDGGVNRGRWFDGNAGQCVVVNADASAGDTISAEGKNYYVVGTINENEYFPVMNVYKEIPIRNLSVLWDNDSTVPNIIISENSEDIVNPTHYVVITSSPAESLEIFKDINYTDISELYKKSYENAAYKKRVLRPLSVTSALLASLAIFVIVGIMIEKNKRILLTFILYGGDKNKGYLCGLIYLTTLTIISAIIGIVAFALINDRALNSSALFKIAMTDSAVVISYFVFFTLSYLIKNNTLNYKILRGN